MLRVVLVALTFCALACASTTVGIYNVFGDNECDGTKPAVTSAAGCVGCVCTASNSASSVSTCAWVQSTSIANETLRSWFCTAVTAQNAVPTMFEDGTCLEHVGPKPTDGCYRCVGLKANDGSVVSAQWQSIDCPSTTCDCGIFPAVSTVTCETDAGVAGTATLQDTCVSSNVKPSECWWLRSVCVPISVVGEHDNSSNSGDTTTCHCEQPSFIGTCDDGTQAQVSDDCLLAPQSDGSVKCQFRQYCPLPPVGCDCPSLDTLSLADRAPVTCYNGDVSTLVCGRSMESGTAVCKWKRTPCPEPPTTDPCANVQCSDHRHCQDGKCVRDAWSYVLTFNLALDDTQRATLEQVIANQLSQRLNRDASDFHVACASNAATDRTSCLVVAAQSTSTSDDDPVESNSSSDSQQADVEAAGQASATAVNPNAALLSATPNSSANANTSSSGARVVLAIAAVAVVALALLF